jgi:LPXTG-motif cell wall-anchored protein
MRITIAAGVITLIVAMGIASADAWNKKTVLDVKETILIPGKELPPGKYVMKLMDSQSNRHIVQVMNEDESKVESTILAIPNYRLQPTGDTELRYWETQAGTPPALRAWFFPGDNFGQEFAYPKDVADRIAAANKTNVPWLESSRQDAESLKSAEIRDFDKGSVVAEENPAARQPAGSEPQVLAQNRPQAETPAPAPTAAPSAAEAQTPRQADPQTPPSELPQTASPVWALGLAGCMLLGSGLGLLRVRRIS